MGFWKTRGNAVPVLMGVILVIVIVFPRQGRGQEIQINEIAFEEWNLSDGEEWGNGWVEIKNISDDTLSTHGFSLTLNNAPPWQFPDTLLGINEYLLVWLSGKDRNSPGRTLHASFTITEERNAFTIRDDSRNLTLDSVSVAEKMYWDESRIRFPENSNSWYNSNLRTPGYQNPSPGPWKRVSSKTKFSPRDSAPNAALYFQNKLWVMEGWGGEHGASSNIWVSTDGSLWESVNESPPYDPYASYIVFKNKMWAFDGNAYSSTDGVEWTKEAVGLPFTVNNRVAELNDNLFVIAGKSIYKSPDGISWSKVAEAPWNAREFPGLVQFKDALWFYGGGINYLTGSDYYYNDVWTSQDGITWIRVMEHAQWQGRLWFGFTSFDDKMWMMGGWNYHDLYDDHIGNKNDVWFTEDGLVWKSLNTSTVWQPRHAPLVWTTPNALFLSSGYLNNYGLLNDVWKLDRSEDIIATTYYLQADQDLYATSSWGTNTDGSGLSPSHFNYDYQRFIIANQDSIGMDKDFVIDGKNSELVVGSDTQPIYVHVPTNVTIDADVKLNNNATVHFEGNQLTPKIESVDETSTVIIGDRTILNARSIGQLVITGKGNLLTQSTLIKKSVTLANVGAIRSDSFTLKYAPLSTLLFESSENHRVSRAEWPADSPPTNVTINCGCVINRRGSTSFDSLTLTSGRMEISHGVLSANHINNASKQSYVITGTGGYLETLARSGSTLFPVGTATSYNPIDINVLAEDVMHPFRANVFDANDIEDPEYAVHVGYNISYASSDAPPYEVTLHWNADNEGKLLDPNFLILVKPRDEGELVSTKSFQSNTDVLIDRDNRKLSSVLYETGTYYLTDGRFVNETDDVLVFPNPSVDHIFILFNVAQESPVHLQLLDLSGNPVYTDNLEIGNRIYPVDWRENISPGLYLLRLDDGKKAVVKKMVIN